MGFEGSLAENSSIEAFREVLTGRKSGHLVVRKGTDEVTFHFVFGAITLVEGKALVRKYHEVLHRTGSVDFDRIEQAAAKGETLTGFETELVKLGAFERKDLKEHFLTAIKEAMWVTFAWKDGTFAFTDVRPTRPIGPDDMSLPTAQLLLEGIRNLADQSVVDRGLGDRLDKKLNAPQFQRIEAQMKTLRPEEGFILSRIDGTVTIDEVCSLSSLPHDQTLRVLYGLISSGVLEFEEAPVPLKQTSTEFRPRTRLDSGELDLSGVGLADLGGGATDDDEEATAEDEGAARSGEDEGSSDDDMSPRERKAKAREALDKGRRLVDLQSYSKAVPFLKEACSLSDRDPESWLLLGTALGHVQGSRKEAEEALMRSIDLNQKNPEPYVELGLLYKRMGVETKARLQFENALRWDPSHPVARGELKREGMSAIKEDLSEALDGVKDTVNKVWKDVFRGRKK